MDTRPFVADQSAISPFLGGTAQEWTNREPPKNGLIALWPNTRVVKYEYQVVFQKNDLGPMIRSSGTMFYSLIYHNSQRGHGRLKYCTSVI